MERRKFRSAHDRVSEFFFKMLKKIAAAERIAVVAGSVFGNPNGPWQNVIKFLGTFDDSVGINLPVKVVPGAVFADSIADSGDG